MVNFTTGTGTLGIHTVLLAFGVQKHLPVQCTHSEGHEDLLDLLPRHGLRVPIPVGDLEAIGCRFLAQETYFALMQLLLSGRRIREGSPDAPAF